MKDDNKRICYCIYKANITKYIVNGLKQMKHI